MTRVTFIATAADGSCGIGTYTGELRPHIRSDVDDELVQVQLASVNPLSYLRAALSAGLRDTDVIHIQHEYGIYGPKSLMSWLFFPLIHLLTTFRGVPVVVTMHSAWNSETIGPPAVGLKRIYVALNNRLLATTADHLIFLSENSKELFEESVGVSPEKYSVLAHGVPTETVDLDQSDAKARFGYDPADTLIVEPGYVRKEKGSDTFVELASRLPEYEFLLAGGVPPGADPSFLDELESNSPENVQTTGILDNDRFQAVFRAADLVVLPYRSIHQSGVFNWCVAYGLPVVASDIDYFRRISDRYGCVHIINRADIECTVKDVKELIENEISLNNLAENMLEYKRSQSMDEVASQHVEIYNKSMKNE